MKETMEEYGGVLIGIIAVLELMAIIAEITLFSSNYGTLGHMIDAITSRFL